MGLHLRGFRRWEYLGFKRFLQYKDIRNLDFPWGVEGPKKHIYYRSVERNISRCQDTSYLQKSNRCCRKFKKEGS